MFGHAQRKAIKTRTMPRAQWRALTSTLRRESRNEYTPEQRRAAALARELCRLVPVDIGERFGEWRITWDNAGPMGGFDTPAGYVSRAALIRSAMPQCIGQNRKG